jgi:hypothetical protein
MNIVNVLQLVDNSFLQHGLEKTVNMNIKKMTEKELEHYIEARCYKMITKSVIVNLVQNKKLNELQLNNVLEVVSSGEGNKLVAQHALVNLDINYESLQRHVVLPSSQYQ